MSRDDPPSDDVFAPRAGAPPRLRQLAAWAGIVLVASCSIPIETRHDGARFVWQIAPDLRVASVWALLAPAMAGLVVVVAAWRCVRVISLAIVVVAAMVGTLLMGAWARAILAWDLLPGPAAFAYGPAASLAAVSFAAAGAYLAQREATRRVARGCLAAASALAVLHLVLPIAGESPVQALIRVVPHVAAHSGRGNLGGAVLLSAVVAWPAIAVGAAWMRFARPRSTAWWALALRLGFPVAIAPVVVPALLDPWREITPTTALAGIVDLGPWLLLAPAALVVLATSERDREETGWPPSRTAILAAVATTILAAVTQWAGRPPRSAPGWTLSAPAPAGDRLFGALIPAWNEARGEDAGPLAAEAVALARSLDGNLGAALAALLRESASPSLGELRWYRLVEAVNDASRAARLPYYVDPTAVMARAGEPGKRWYRVDTHRIERVNRRRVGTRELATLHVRSMAPQRGRLAAMGMSRDVQPFAVVALDEIASYAADLEPLAERGRCREAPGETDAIEQALRGCGELLASIVHSGDLRAALLATTERHELQHQLDAPETPPSARLARRLAWAMPEHRRRVEREVRAYLAQMTAGPPAASLTLVRLARMVSLSRTGIEHDAAVLAFEALGEDAVSWWRSFERLRGLDEAALADRARRAFQRLFGEDPQIR